MKTCPYCGKEAPEGVTVCPVCHAELPKVKAETEKKSKQKE